MPRKPRTAQRCARRGSEPTGLGGETAEWARAHSQQRGPAQILKAQTEETNWEKEMRQEILSISLSTCNMIFHKADCGSDQVKARNAVYHIIGKQVEAEYCSFAMKAPSPFLAKLHRYMLRVRWSKHGEFAGYDTAGFLRCVRNRILVQLLDSLVVAALQARAHFGFEIVQDQRGARAALLRAYARALPSCMYPEDDVISYPEVVLSRVAALAKPRHAFALKKVSVPWASVRGPRFAQTHAEMAASGDTIVRQLPEELWSRPVDPTTCWECGATRVVTSVCNVCRSARYCGRACQKRAWRTHKLECMKLAEGRLPKTVRRQLQALDKGPGASRSYQQVIKEKIQGQAGSLGDAVLCGKPQDV